MHIDRFMTAAVSSGSGKTLITCGLLELLKRRGLNIAAFKCGPDYIDPMFHTRVLGTKSRNLDPYFTGHDRTRMLLAKNSEGADLAVLEGVMGFYDGITPESSEGGASDLAGITETPVLLIVPARGMSRSVLAEIRGFLDFPGGDRIRGIILNRVPASFYPALKDMIVKETGIPVVGYVPVLDASMTLESRHLGLILPDEITELRKNISRIADLFERTMDVDKILSVASKAPDLPDAEISRTWSDTFSAASSAAGTPRLPEPSAEKGTHSAADPKGETVRIGIAEDEAFCFFYEDNLELLRRLGAELVPFSPVHDRNLPEDLDGLLLHGGYPELYASELSSNAEMRGAIRAAILAGLPVQAECGGFLYLFRELEDMEGRKYPMAGIFPGTAHYTGHLTRFGYVELQGKGLFGGDDVPVRAHEFHYYDADDPGNDLLAVKPSGKRSWRCAHVSDVLYAGFPHLYYYAEPRIAGWFVRRCRQFHSQTEDTACIH